SPDCKPEPATCSGTIDLTVTFVSGDGTDHTKSVYGLDVSVGYPTSTSFPGDGVLPVGDPSDPSTRLFLLGGGGNLYAALASFLDGQAPFCPCDEFSSPPCDPTAVPRQLGCPATGIRTVLNFVGATDTFVLPESGGTFPVERIRFDCPSGTQVSEADFPCFIVQVSGAQGVLFSRDQLPACRVSLSRAAAGAP